MKSALASLFCAWILWAVIDGRWMTVDSYEQLEPCKDHIVNIRNSDKSVLAVCLPESVDPRKPR